MQDLRLELVVRDVEAETRVRDERRVAKYRLLLLDRLPHGLALADSLGTARNVVGLDRLQKVGEFSAKSDRLGRWSAFLSGLEGVRLFPRVQRFRQLLTARFALLVFRCRPDLGLLRLALHALAWPRTF